MSCRQSGVDALTNLSLVGRRRDEQGAKHRRGRRQVNVVVVRPAAGSLVTPVATESGGDGAPGRARIDVLVEEQFSLVHVRLTRCGHVEECRQDALSSARKLPPHSAATVCLGTYDGTDVRGWRPGGQVAQPWCPGDFGLGSIVRRDQANHNLADQKTIATRSTPAAPVGGNSRRSGKAMAHTMSQPSVCLSVMARVAGPVFTHEGCARQLRPRIKRCSYAILMKPGAHGGINHRGYSDNGARTMGGSAGGGDGGS